MPSDLRRATADDADALGRLMGEAFRDDPIARWTLGDPRAITATYVTFARRVYVHHGCSFIAPGRGGAMWLPPTAGSGDDALASLTVAGALTRFSGVAQIGRALRMDLAMKRHHPREAHYYLFLIGVVPTARGQGLAGRLMRTMLEQADAEGVPTYLENSNPVNTRFYEGLGYQSRPPFMAAPGAPPLVPMWRAVGGAVSPFTHA